MRDLGSGVFLQLILMDGDELRAHGGGDFLPVHNEFPAFLGKERRSRHRSLHSCARQEKTPCARSDRNI